jgi:hypothetical protein
MEECRMRKVTEAVSFSLAALVFTAGYKSNQPQIAGKWHGTGQLTATFTTAISSTPRTQTFPVDLVLVLTQNGQTVQGDAAVAAAKNPPIHIPIRTGVVGTDGKLSLEGDEDSALARTHLSFDGKAEEGKITGTVNVALDNVSGNAQNKGTLTLEQIH